MEFLHTFFGNPSIAAFVGAFAAFLLVLFTDIRRRHRTKSLLVYLVQDSVDLARFKLAAVQTQIDMIRNNKFVASPVMRFNTTPLSHKHYEVMDLLDGNENQALSGLIYQMEAIDMLLEDARQTARELKYLGSIETPTTERAKVGER